MISRLQLNLRSVTINDRETTLTNWAVARPHLPKGMTTKDITMLSTMGMSASEYGSVPTTATLSTKWVGNLGEDLEPLEASTHWSDASMEFVSPGVDEVDSFEMATMSRGSGPKRAPGL